MAIKGKYVLKTVGMGVLLASTLSAQKVFAQVSDPYAPVPEATTTFNASQGGMTANVPVENNNAVSDPTLAAIKSQAKAEQEAREEAENSKGVNDYFTDDYGMQRLKQAKMGHIMVTLSPEQHDTTGSVNAFGAYVPTPPRPAMDGTAPGTPLTNDKSIGISSEQFLGHMVDENPDSKFLQHMYDNAKDKSKTSKDQ